MKERIKKIDGHSIIKQYFRAASGRCLSEGETVNEVTTDRSGSLLGQIERGPVILSTVYSSQDNPRRLISSTCQLWRLPAAVLLLLSST